MDSLPIEVIGNILSHVASARDVVIASTTCRKWREAARHHLHKLTFASSDWQHYNNFTVSLCEIIITETVMRTKCLHELSICMGLTKEFSAALVIAWLMHTKETLKSLTFMNPTQPKVNILEKCGGQKLERLVWGFAHISTVDPTIHKFPSLISLTLNNRAALSALDLNLLLSVCPKLEILSLANIDISFPNARFMIELNSASLKTLYIEGLSVDTVVLEADKLESLILRDSTFEQFELVSKGSLRHLRIEDVSIIQLDIGQSADLLEEVIVSDFTIIWPRFYQMISRASNLQKLRLGGLDAEEEAIDLDMIGSSFPSLNFLALNYNIGDGHYEHAFRGSTILEKVVVLELGTAKIHELSAQWIAGFLERCPNLKKLGIHGTISEAKSRKDYQLIGRFTSSIINLMRQYPHVDVNFEFC
ncbi:hypothetical protein GOP47_0021794 [Adiantum capillus-veneris]|uniref:F-box domain-containing protein n=1 Tax=Adiantum capillus-veneris TaxID=13818 RepID=A0A9D4Z798_ADICA|nr:hypothetical protein GOP47_0021794 [Adiantum capillus-veneris]